MQVRFAVAPDSAVREAAQLIGFAEAVEAAGFDGVWLCGIL